MGNCLVALLLHVKCRNQKDAILIGSSEFEFRILSKNAQKYLGSPYDRCPPKAAMTQRESIQPANQFFTFLHISPTKFTPFCLRSIAYPMSSLTRAPAKCDEEAHYEKVESIQSAELNRFDFDHRHGHSASSSTRLGDDSEWIL
jgi:hypothetical protein